MQRVRVRRSVFLMSSLICCQVCVAALPQTRLEWNSQVPNSPSFVWYSPLYGGPTLNREWRLWTNGSLQPGSVLWQNGYPADFTFRKNDISPVSESPKTIFVDSTASAPVACETIFSDSSFTIANASPAAVLQSSGFDTWSGTLSVSATLGGAQAIIKNGPGTVILAGANTFTGQFAINAGTVRATNAASLGGGTATVNVNTGSSLEVNSNTSFSISRPLVSAIVRL